MSNKKPHSAAEWDEAARALPAGDFTLNVPIHVLLGEAVDVARFFATHYSKHSAREAGTHDDLTLWLDSVGSARLPATTGAEILSLVEVCQKAQTEYVLSVDPSASGADLVLRGQREISELRAVLEFHWDDGVVDEHDAQLAAVESAHQNDPQSADAVASALEDYSTLARPFAAELEGVGGFEAKVIDQAHKTAQALRALPAAPAPASDRAQLALDHRNRLFTLLSVRIARVRSAARFVYRQYPSIAREATSHYQRQRRSAARRAALKKPPTPPA